MKKPFAVLMALLMIFFLSACGEIKNTVSTPEDSIVNIAITALKQQWKELYSEDMYDVTNDKRLEIIHTQVLTIDADTDDEFSKIVENGENISYIVEFELLTNWFNSAPYYTNNKIYDTVIIYKDATTKVTSNLSSIYSKKAFNYNFEDFLVKINDYGSSFNEVYNFN